MANPNRNHRDTSPVMVVGVGPTGLAAAMDLARFGIPCRLIEKRPEPQTHSRAVAIQPRTLELFEQRGCVAPFLELGHKAHWANFDHGDRQFLRLGFDRLPSRYHFVVFLDQTKTERILAEKLAQLGVAVECGVELVHFADLGDRVELVLSRRDRTEERASTPFLLGCDGAHSFVREHLHLRFEGKTFPGSYLLADVHIDWDMPDENEFYVFTSDQGLVPTFNLGGGISRLVADIPKQQSGDKPSLQECQAIVDQRLTQLARLSDLRWSAYFHINSRCVEKLRVDRVFVAGDAAHIHSPAGGQGMNTGIQAAINLAWKIAFVVRGEADERLLDTYDEERGLIEKKVIARTDTTFRMVGARGGVMAVLRDNLVPLLANIEPVQCFITDFISELGIEYRSSSVAPTDKLGGGARAADAAVSVSSGPNGRSGEMHIFDLISPAKFTLLLLDPAPSADASANDRAAAIVSNDLPQSLNVWHVTDTSVPALSEHYGRERPLFYLIRPDGYVMLRGTPADADKAAHFCRQ